MLSMVLFQLFINCTASGMWEDLQAKNGDIGVTVPNWTIAFRCEIGKADDHTEIFLLFFLKLNY